MHEPSSLAPLVSVIIPAYNGENLLAATLASAFAQTYAPLEVIVIDDGSTDQTGRVAQSFPSVKYVRQENRGNAAARNRGLVLAAAEFVALLDQDDLWHPQKIEIQMRALNAHPEAAYVLCKGEVLLEPGQTLPPTYGAETWSKPFFAPLPSALLARKVAFDRIGTFDTALRFGNDADWFARAVDGRLATVPVPEVLLQKRVHGANQGHAVGPMRRELFQLLQSSIHRKRALNRPSN